MFRSLARLRGTDKKLFNVMPVALETYHLMRTEGGCDHASACAWVGNEEAEDGFDNTKMGDSETAHGPAQHHMPRIEIIRQSPPNGCGIDILTASHADQIRAIIWEATSARGYKRVMSRVKAATTMREKIRVIVEQYEQSQNPGGRDVARRTAYANYWLEKIPPNVVPDPTGPRKRK